jgi:hypothetical protein
MSKRVILAVLVGWLIAFVLPPRELLNKVRGG